MNIDKLIFKDKQWQILQKQECTPESVNIMFVFDHIKTLKQYDHSSLLKTLYPNAFIVGCSTAGKILDTSIDEYSAVATAISFDTAHVCVHNKEMNVNSLSEDINTLVNKLDKKELKHIFLLVPGMINGSEVIKGLKLEKDVTITGALVGDGSLFKDTYQFFTGQK